MTYLTHPPSLDSQTRVQLAQYLDGNLSVDELRRVFARLAWALDSDEVTDANPMTATTSLLLAEYEAGHRDESELMLLFDALLRIVITNSTTVSIAVSFPPVHQPR